jgi:hypothetical protein
MRTIGKNFCCSPNNIRMIRYVVLVRIPKGNQAHTKPTIVRKNMIKMDVKEWNVRVYVGLKLLCMEVRLLVCDDDILI